MEEFYNMDVKTHNRMFQFSENIPQRIREETERELEPIALKEMVFTGRPGTIQEAPQLCKPYWNFRDEISTEEKL